MNKSNKSINQPKECYFCVNGIKELDYKEIKVLQRFLSSYAKILPRKKTGVCSKHQRKLAQAVKRARIMALIPFTTR
ncbi:30S ribosomal protein S18 [Patescibacteria group bacterium]|nr:30S ribosomal protein S18 [Patescibacteria group bacterium]